MFDFEKLKVYQNSRVTVRKVLLFLYQGKDLDPNLVDQLKRSSTSIIFNLAEGTGRNSMADKRHFYTIARSSAYESVAVLQVFLDMGQIDPSLYDELYEELSVISKMLYGIIRSTR
jgi:four helix bundle protein